MQKSYGLCDANGMVRGFVHSNVINVEPKSTKHDELTLERVESKPPRSLKDHFWPPQTSPGTCFDLPLVAKNVPFKLNLDYVSMLLNFTCFEVPSLFMCEFE